MIETPTENPFEMFASWLEAAKAEPTIIEPTAMTLATATSEAVPSARIVLLKHWDEHGFVFYTNLESRKSTEIKQNPQASLCFYWMALDKQVRIDGTVQAVSDDEADAYYNSRPRGSRIGAWSSQQSRPLDSRDTLQKAVQEYTDKFDGEDIPRPPYWSGWRVVPHYMEFWQQGQFRLHDRFVYTSDAANTWVLQRLYP